MNKIEKVKNNIFMLLTHLQTARELEKTIIEELLKLSKEYELTIDLDNCRVEDWGKLKDIPKR